LASPALRVPPSLGATPFKQLFYPFVQIILRTQLEVASDWSTACRERANHIRQPLKEESILKTPVHERWLELEYTAAYTDIQCSLPYSIPLYSTEYLGSELRGGVSV
jgi:hypothetical protein